MYFTEGGVQGMERPRRVRKAACPLPTASLQRSAYAKSKEALVGGFERLRGGITDAGTQSAHLRFLIRPDVRCKSALFRRMSLMNANQ